MADPHAGPYDHVVFLHIQKTAGTSLFRMLVERLGKPAISHGDFLRYQPTDLAPFRLIAGHFGYEYLRAIPGRNFTFTFLREPVDRVVSLYHFMQNRDPKEYEIYKLAQQMSFSEFVRSEHPVVSAHIDDAQVWQLAHGWPDGQWQPTREELLARAVANLETLCFFGFQETFDGDVVELARCLGLEISPHQLSRYNRSERPAVDALPTDVVEVIRRRTALDRRLYEGALARRGARAGRRRLEIGALRQGLGCAIVALVSALG